MKHQLTLVVAGSAAVVSAAAVLVAVLAATAWDDSAKPVAAASPAASRELPTTTETITACVDPEGLFRLASEPRCGENRLVEWNVQGPAGPPGTAGKWFFASINAGGIQYGKGATGLQRTAGAGVYQVTFNEDISGCAAVATSRGTVGTFPVTTRASKQDVGVIIFRHDGVLVDSAFDLVIIC